MSDKQLELPAVIGRIAGSRRAAVLSALTLWLGAASWCVWNLGSNPPPADPVVILDELERRIDPHCSRPALFDGTALWMACSSELRSHELSLVRMEAGSGRGSVLLRRPMLYLAGIARGPDGSVALLLFDHDEVRVVVAHHSGSIIGKEKLPVSYLQVVGMAWNGKQLEIVERGCALCNAPSPPPSAGRAPWLQPPKILVVADLDGRYGATWSHAPIVTPEPKPGWDMQLSCAQRIEAGWELTYTSARLDEPRDASHQLLEIATADERGRVRDRQQLSLPSWSSSGTIPILIPGELQWHLLDRTAGNVVTILPRELERVDGVWGPRADEISSRGEDYYAAAGRLWRVIRHAAPRSLHTAFAERDHLLPTPDGGYWLVSSWLDERARHARFDRRGRRIGGPGKLARLGRMIAGNHTRLVDDELRRPSAWQRVAVPFILLGLPLLLAIAARRRRWACRLYWSYTLGALILLLPYVRAVRLI